MHTEVKLIECPRDAMQGWKTFIPTETKIEYARSLLKVGFDTLDVGSFVSPKAIPQMADTADVLNALKEEETDTKLLVIVANRRGAEEACRFSSVRYLGFPFSVSETFQQRNTNSSIAESLERVKEIQELCVQHAKELVIYISMGFGNPYGDPYSPEIVYYWVDQIVRLGVNIISLADTVGLATEQQVYKLSYKLKQELPEQEIGVHLHSTRLNRQKKIEAAWNAGIRRFDGALKGIGGCPMANDELVGNMDTEWMIQYFRSKQALPNISLTHLQQSLTLAGNIFNS